MSYRVAYQHPDGRLGSDRIGLPMSLLDARLAASRYNDIYYFKDGGQYVVIHADTEEVVK